MASQARASQPSILPPTLSSRTVVMASPSHPASQNQTPTVPSVRMASPEPLRSRNDLTSMEVNHILVLIGSDPIGLLLSERRDQVLSLSREDSRITQDGCSGRTRWSSSLNLLNYLYKFYCGYATTNPRSHVLLEGSTIT